jgi:hypothetical protein
VSPWSNPGSAADASEKIIKKDIGSSFEFFLEEKGIKDDVELRAQKVLLAEQIREAMGRRGVSFSAFATSMGTSGTVVYRLLDPNDTGVTLETLSRVERVLGLGLTVSLAYAPRAGARTGSATSDGTSQANGGEGGCTIG